MKTWYKFYVGECPICGKNKSFKRLQKDTPKPQNPQDRIVYLRDAETYDWCLG